MKIQFLGTGAADWDWTRPLDGKVRGSTCTLLDDRILIDAGKTAWENLLRFRIDPAKISDLLITHSHSDHFNPENIGKIATAPGRREKLRVYASPEAVGRLDTAILTAKKLCCGKVFRVRGLRVEVLPANHALENGKEDSFHFLMDTPERKRLFYALDGGWMTSRERLGLGNGHIDMIIWDATAGTSRNNWRFADHNDLWMIRAMRTAMKSLKLVDGRTIHVFDHIARTLWPASAEERKKAAEKFRGILAEDGMIMDL